MPHNSKMGLRIKWGEALLILPRVRMRKVEGC